MGDLDRAFEATLQATASPMVVTVRPRYKRGSVSGWEVLVNHEGGLAKAVATFPSKSDASHYAAWYAEMNGIPYREEKVATKAKRRLSVKTAANPYSPSDNPYVPSPTTPGTPDELLDGPNDPYPVTLDMKTPMTTRPRQMPGGGKEDEDVSVEQPPGTVATKITYPIVCHACDRRFSVGRVTSSLRCVCGSNDLDLDTEEHQFLISWALRDTGEPGQSLVRAANELDALRWIRINFAGAEPKTIWKVTEKQAKIIRQAMEGDPPFQYIVQGDQPLGMLPENDQFAVPFTDENPDGEGVEARKVAELSEGDAYEELHGKLDPKALYDLRDRFTGKVVYTYVFGGEAKELINSDSRLHATPSVYSPGLSDLPDGNESGAREARKTASAPKLVFNLGGPYGYVYPKGHENMKLGWDLFSGEVEILREDGRSTVVARDVTSKEKFRKIADEFFAGIFSEARKTASAPKWEGLTEAFEAGEAAARAGAPRIYTGEQVPSTPVGSPESTAWARRAEAWYAGYDTVINAQMVESLEAEGSKTATRWFQCQMCGHEYSTRNQWKIECPNCGSIEVRQATKTQPDPIQAKVQEVARGILATNKGMDPAEAHKLATKTVKRFPQMVKAAGPEKSGNFGDPGWYIAERDGTAIVGPYATEQDALDALRPLRTLGDPGEFHHVIHREGAKTADYSPEEAGVKVGDIFYTSWGYDQTNVEFYEVTGLTGASVKIRQIASEDVSSDSDMHMRLVPKPGVYVDALPLRGQEVTKRLVGSPGSPSLKIDDSRRAWLWDGKPKYQTGYGYGH